MPNPPWKQSYEVLLYDTPSGWLDNTQFAFTEDGSGLVIGTSATPIPGHNVDFVPLTFDVTGRTKANIIGKAWYHEFTLPNGKTLQVQTNQTGYQGLAGKNPNNPNITLTQAQVDAFSQPGVVDINLPPNGNSF